MKRRFSSISAKILCASFLAAAAPLNASTLNPSGDLDTTFAGNGKPSFNFATVQVPADSRALIVQSDGKIVIGGGSNNGLFKDYVLVRMNTNGTTDSSFGNGGVAQTDMGFDDHINAMAANTTGSRFCGGGISDHDFGVACYTANGDLDLSFNTTGIDKSNPPSSSGGGRIEGMTFDRNNKLIVVGWTNFTGGTRDWIIRRYNVNGTPDNTFGTNSWVRIDWSNGTDRAFDVAVLKGATANQDRYIVTGTAANTAGGLVILTPTGQLDTASNALTGTTGRYSGTPGNLTQFRGIAIQSNNNNFVVTGQGPNAGFIVARSALTTGTFTTQNLGASTNDVGFRIRVGASDLVYASGTANSGVDFNIARLSADISSVQFKTATDFSGGSDFAQDLAIDSNGFVTAVGTIGGGLNTIAAARYTNTGVLDTNFGTGGKYNAVIFGGSADTPNATAVQSDGKVVITGITLNGSGNYDFLTMRANTDGTKDTTFASATSGWDTRGISAGSADEAKAVAIEPAGAPTPGRIVVAGNTSTASGSNFVAIRYLTNGTLDTSCGGTGIKQDNWGANSEANAVAIQSDGKIVIGGDITLNGDFTFARLNVADCSLDTSFNVTGKQTVGIAPGTTSDVLHAMAIDPSGKIVAGGACIVGGVFKMCLARLNANGSLDTTFDSDGKVLINNLPFDDNNDDTFTIRSLQILPDLDTPSATDYKIVVGGQVVVTTTVGSTVTTKANWLLARFNFNGSLDTTFNSTGVKELDPVAAGYVGAINSVALQHDEKIVAFGESSQPDPVNPGFFLNRQITVGRFNWDGSLDTTYGTSGWTRATIGSDPGEAFSGYVYPSGALMGKAVNTAFIISSDFALTRYQADPAPITGASAPDLAAASDTGRSSTDNITKDTTPTFTGTCSEGETVYLLVNGAQTQPRTRQICPTAGTYSLTTPALSGVPRTTYSFTTQTQTGIGDSAVSSALSVTIDAEINPVIAITAPAAGSNQLLNPTISGTSAESTADIVITSTGSGTGCASFQAAADGTWSCTSGLLQGPQTISVVQTDIAGNVGSPVTRSFSVKAPTTTTVMSSSNPSKFGQPVTFTATVTPSGAHNLSVAGTTVQFLIDGVPLSTPTLDVNGQATFTPSSSVLTVGSHTVQAVYAENANWLGSSGSVAPDQVVQKSDTSTNVGANLNPTVFGQAVTFTATVSAVAPGAGTPTGTVTFLDSGNPVGSGPLVGGVATFTTATLAVGSHTITTNYTGDGNFNGSSGALGAAQIVNKANTATAVTSSLNPSTLNQSVTFTATVSALAPGSGTPTGTITFLDGGNSIGTGTLSGGVATLPISTLTVGNHTITTTYTGDGNFNGSGGSLTGNPQVVKKVATTTSVTSSQNPSKFGQSVTFTATVVVTPPATGTPTGTVTFLDGGTSIGTGPLDGSGVATFTTSTLTTGNHTITASYGSDATFDVSTGTMTGNPQVVSKADTTTALTSGTNPSVFGQSVTFTATITATAPGAGTPSGLVTFLDGGSSIGTGTLSSGVATFTTSTLAVGNHTITTTYPGDTNFKTSGGSLTGNPQVVNKADVTTALTSSQNPSLPSQSVTFTATLSATAPGAGVPTGTVNFLDGGNPLGSGTLSAGVATFTTSALTPGSHTITSNYTGDGNFNTGSGSLTGNPQVVSKIGTATTIGSVTPPGPITLGSSVAVTASVAVVPPGSGTPTGSITVTSTDTSTNATDTCTFSLPGTGCTLTPTTVGSKAITATYSGDSTFATSTSSVTPFSVTPPTRTITASAGPNGTITPATQFVVDGNTASFTVTPDSGYSAVMSTTCPEGLGTLSNNVYTTLPISGDCTVTATFTSASASLTLVVTDNREFARYGTLVNYIVTLTNSAGSAVSGLSISGSETSASQDLATASGHWICFGSASQCAPSGNGPFTDANVSVPPNGSVSWFVTIPVLSAAPDDAVSYTVTLDGIAPPVVQTDTDMLVIFHDGFDVAYGDGTQSIPLQAPANLAPAWDGTSALTFTLPVKPNGMIETVLFATSRGNSGFRIERLNGAEKTWIRAVGVDDSGAEHASAWTIVTPNASLVLGMMTGPADGQILMIVGAQEEIDLPVAPSSAWRVDAW